MPAPDLTPQTPGAPLATTTPLEQTTDSSQSAPPLYAAKHNGGGRWLAVTNDAKADKVGDFVGTKETVAAEVERLNSGGEPLVLDPQRTNEPAPKAKSAEASTVDATAIKQPVMTAEGWLCPEPPVKG